MRREMNRDARFREQCSGTISEWDHGDDEAAWLMPLLWSCRSCTMSCWQSGTHVSSWRRITSPASPTSWCRSGTTPGCSAPTSPRGWVSEMSQQAKATGWELTQKHGHAQWLRMGRRKKKYVHTPFGFSRVNDRFHLTSKNILKTVFPPRLGKAATFQQEPQSTPASHTPSSLISTCAVMQEFRWIK